MKSREYIIAYYVTLAMAMIIFFVIHFQNHSLIKWTVVHPNVINHIDPPLTPYQIKVLVVTKQIVDDESKVNDITFSRYYPSTDAQKNQVFMLQADLKVLYKQRQDLMSKENSIIN